MAKPGAKTFQGSPIVKVILRGGEVLMEDPEGLTGVDIHEAINQRFPNYLEDDRYESNITSLVFENGNGVRFRPYRFFDLYPRIKIEDGVVKF